MRRFKLCRICFRELALEGKIPGVRKSSWWGYSSLRVPMTQSWGGGSRESESVSQAPLLEV